MSISILFMVANIYMCVGWIRPSCWKVAPPRNRRRILQF